jgi:site-specific DNA recombinase
VACPAIDPDRIDTTLAQLLDAGTTNHSTDHQLSAARRRIAEADTKIERYRIALETGTDPELIAQWITQAQGDRLAAETELARLDQPEPVTAADLAQLIDDIRQDWGDLTTALGAARPEDKAALLTALGVAVSYDPVQRRAQVTCTPRVRERSCRRGDTDTAYRT